MGALTSKRFPFELRSWDIEKFESIDPTDGFGSNTRIYVSKSQIVQIEPEYDIFSFNTWLTDKGRQFFDSIFGTWYQNNSNKSVNLQQNFWLTLTRTIIKNFYFADQLKKNKLNHFFTIVFENLSIEVLSLLITVAQKYSFINLKRAENINKNNNDLEANFQINLTNNKDKLTNSTLCILISTNPRYESYFLNLSLRQRIAKGNFKCFSVGSIIDLTFPVVFLGSNVSVLKTISTGNSLICQNLKSSKRPLTIYNSEIFKRSDGNKIIEMFNTLKYADVFSKTWNSFSVVSNTLSETGIQSIGKFPSIRKKDLETFGVLYFLNVGSNSLTNLKQIIDFKLLSYKKTSKLNLSVNNVFLEQSLIPSKIFEIYNQTFSNNNKYFYLPTNVLYENEETFINIEGSIKRTTKVIFRDKTINNWQMLRKIFKHFKEQVNFLENKNNLLLFLNSKDLIEFKNFTYFQYQATQSLINLNFYLNLKSQPFVIINKRFKSQNTKLFLTKLKYWLDDFYTGGKDEYSKNSFNMVNCSKILRLKTTNFF
jgi:NADH dehydrogenase/NADH:ubiquinone oxidoreductase subunit G